MRLLNKDEKPTRHLPQWDRVEVEEREGQWWAQLDGVELQAREDNTARGAARRLIVQINLGKL